MIIKTIVIINSYQNTTTTITPNGERPICTHDPKQGRFTSCSCSNAIEPNSGLLNPLRSAPVSLLPTYSLPLKVTPAFSSVTCSRYLNMLPWRK